MTFSEQQSQREQVNGVDKINGQNGSQQLNGQPYMQQEQAPRRSLVPYENDPIFHTALAHFKDGAFAAALSLVDRLLKKYPEDKNLEKFKRRVQRRMPTDEFAYRDHPTYLTLRKNIRGKKWAAGLHAADALLMSYPNAQAVREIRQKLDRRVKKQESRTRFGLVGTIVFLAIVLLSVGTIIFRYASEPGPLAQILLPNGGLSYPPHYLFSIHNAEQPVGVGLSPDGERIYVAEMGGTRMVQIFDRSGRSLGSFASPETEPGERAPVYVATDIDGQVYVSDRMQHAIFVFSPDGEYIDTLLGPNLTLSEYVAGHAADQTGEGALAYNLFEKSISITDSSDIDQHLELPDLPLWSPLGIRIGQDNEMILTDVSKNNNRIVKISLGDLTSPQDWGDFDPVTSQYGSSGNGNGEMMFPNSAVADSQGRVYVSDGNNRRISVWDSDGNFQFNFGSGTGPGSLSLPRGLFVDGHDRLYVVDTVAQNVKVFDVSGARPTYLFAFGEFGKGDGSFNYPNDITIDSSGRLYIADRENNRIEVWSY